MITNTKKYFIVGILGLLITGFIGYYIYKVSPLYSKHMLDYIPVYFDKVFYINADQDLRSLIQEMPEDKLKSDAKEQLLNINKVGVFQILTGDKVYDIIIADVKSSFDIKKAEKAGLISTGADYDIQSLGNLTFLYGTKEAISFVKNYNGSSISENPDVKDYISDIKDGKYNTFMISKIDITDDKTAGYFTDYLKFFKYSVLVSHIGKEDNFGQIDILFSNEASFAKEYSFKSVLGEYSKPTDLVFLEIGNLVKFVGLTNEKLNLLVGDFVEKNNSNLAGMFTKTDYESLLKSFDGNVALSIGKADNLVGIGGNIVFEKGEIYDVVKKFYPILQEVVSKNTFSGSISTFEQENKFGVDLIIPFQSGKVDGQIYLEKKGDNAVLSIFNNKFEKSKDNIKLDNNKNTVISFFVNSSSILDLFQRLALFTGQIKDYSKDFDFLKDKKFYGSINYYPNKLNFKIKAVK